MTVDDPTEEGDEVICNTMELLDEDMNEEEKHAAAMNQFHKLIKHRIRKLVEDGMKRKHLNRELWHIRKKKRDQNE